MVICLRDGHGLNVKTVKDNNWYHMHIALSCIGVTCVDVKLLNWCAICDMDVNVTFCGICD